MTLELEVDLPEPWIALRTAPAVRRDELDGFVSASDEVARAFVDRFLAETAELHIVALGVLPIQVDGRLEAMGAVTITMLETALPIEGLIEAVGSGSGTSTGSLRTRAGTALRQYTIGTVDALVREDGLAPVHLHIRYVLPALDRGVVIAIDCSTPHIAYADEFEAIFDGLAGTLELREAVAT